MAIIHTRPSDRMRTGQPSKAREDRALKHRADKDTRPVPICPDLVRILRGHLATFGTGTDGRLFVTRVGKFGRPVAGPYASPITPTAYLRVWH